MVVIRSNEFITTYYCNLMHFITITSTFTTGCLGGYSPDTLVEGFPYYVLLPNITITSGLLPVTTSFSLLPIVVPGRDFPLLRINA